MEYIPYLFLFALGFCVYKIGYHLGGIDALEEMRREMHKELFDL